MKHIKAVIFLVMIAASMGAHATSKALAEKYLRATHIPEVLQAQIDGYADQYAKGQGAAQRKRIHRYLEKAMGWEVLKDEYIELVQATYTEKEINAFLQFAHTSAGRSMQAKNTEFASKAAAFSAKRTQEASEDWMASDETLQGDQQASPSDLTISKVERFQNGDQVYFTGEIKNNGKKDARGVNVEVNLFMGERFVDQYSTYISGSISAGGTRLFKVSCGCKGSPPAEHDSFKLQVLGGY